MDRNKLFMREENIRVSLRYFLNGDIYARRDLITNEKVVGSYLRICVFGRRGKNWGEYVTEAALKESRKVGKLRRSVKISLFCNAVLEIFINVVLNCFRKFS